MKGKNTQPWIINFLISLFYIHFVVIVTVTYTENASFMFDNDSTIIDISMFCEHLSTTLNTCLYLSFFSANYNLCNQSHIVGL